jgi:hypothetical protein
MSCKEKHVDANDALLSLVVAGASSTAQQLNHSVSTDQYILDAHAVVDARTSSSFSSNSSDAIGANGRQCILASMHIDRARYFLRINDHDKFAAFAWTGIDLSSVCLFSALNLKLKTPFRDRIEQNFRHIFWNLHLFDRAPLPVMDGCKE